MQSAVGGVDVEPPIGGVKFDRPTTLMNRVMMTAAEWDEIALPELLVPTQ